jgi:nucleotide-binding universal stress UspA family protein
MSESSERDRIVTVGVDGSVGSAAALRWAVEHADGLGTIIPVMTFGTGPFEYGFGTVDGTESLGEPYRSEAIMRLERFLEEHAPSLVGAGAVVESRAGPGLVRLAEGSELLVVGTRGWSARRGLALGSVGAYCARHSSVPVALIPHGARPVDEHLDVVVGFDGSAHAQGALRWTLTHVLPSARVVAVRAYDSVIGEPLSLSPDDAAARASADLEAGVDAILSELDGHPPVELRVALGDPRIVLAAASDDADLLVVGSRGQGVLDRLLLGSVASALADHPTLPTIMVPDLMPDLAPTAAR